MRHIRPVASLLTALSVASCAPLTTTTLRSEPRTTLHRTEALAPDSAEAQFPVSRAGTTLLLDARTATLCRVAQTEETFVHEVTTVEPSRRVIAAEIAVASASFALTGLVFVSGIWKEGIGGSDSDPPREQSGAGILFVATPLLVGSIATFGAVVDINSFDESERVRSHKRPLPERDAPCSPRALDGIPVQLRGPNLTLQSHFGREGTASFSLESVEVELPPHLDVFIGNRLVGRARLGEE
jgi:hypothetical protein